jgi:hypothetical protein
MDPSKVEIKNIQELLERDNYMKPYENEIRRRFVRFQIDHLILKNRLSRPRKNFDLEKFPQSHSKVGLVCGMENCISGCFHFYAGSLPSPHSVSACLHNNIL